MKSILQHFDIYNHLYINLLLYSRGRPFIIKDGGGYKIGREGGGECQVYYYKKGFGAGEGGTNSFDM